MIKFRKKNPIQDLRSEALDHLRKLGIPVNLISEEKADEVSKANSRSMVLRSFIKNEAGGYEIQIQDKALYRYTQKLVDDIFNMRILEIDRKNRTITAQTEYIGIAMDIIEVLGLKYNLSMVQE